MTYPVLEVVLRRRLLAEGAQFQSLRPAKAGPGAPGWGVLPLDVEVETGIPALFHDFGEVFEERHVLKASDEEEGFVSRLRRACNQLKRVLEMAFACLWLLHTFDVLLRWLLAASANISI
ncbi:hypothetical protein KFK09_019229 [Dendrobium nobile]|uniref:Uncharacterized protein n=1 Tax=Dendrobium nobile TaxID=94219 RepID=A0A8T3AY58_DENNO|nr:hypothetical protein KFK09_019229 [Dendrobium nobile]